MLYTEFPDPPPKHSFHPRWNFRQHTPALQLVAVWQNLKMTHANFEDGIISAEKLHLQLAILLPQVDFLVGMVYKNQGWTEVYELGDEAAP